MFHWQLAVLFILFITIICIASSSGDKDPKMCLSLSGSDNGAQCSAFCKSKGKTGGSCKKKRCVCNGDKSGEDNNKGKEGKTKDRSLTFSTKSTSNIDLSICQLHCKNMGKSNGSLINGLCVCSK